MKAPLILGVGLICFAGCQHRRPRIPEHLPVPENVYYARETRQIRLEIDGRQFKPTVDLEKDVIARDYYGVTVIVIVGDGRPRAAVIETKDGRIGTFGAYAEETWDTAWSNICDGNIDARVPIGSDIRRYLFLIRYGRVGEIDGERHIFEMEASDLPDSPDEFVRVAKFSELPRFEDRHDRETIKVSEIAAKAYAKELRKLLD